MRTIALLLLSVLLSAPLAAAANEWPQEGYDETHQSRVPSTGNTEFVPFLQRWWNNISIPAIPGSPVVFENIVYIGDSAGNLHAFDRESGGLLWTAPTVASASILGAPAVGGDSVYVLISTGSIYAFDRKTGTKITGYPISIGGSAQGSVMFHTLQNLLVGAGGATIKAFFANTREAKWTFGSSGTFHNTTCTGGTIEGTPAIFEDFVFFGSTNGCFYAIDARATGGSTISSPKWVFKAENSIRSSSAIDRDGRRVVFGDLSGNVYAISVDAAGQVLSASWKYTEPLKEGLSSEFKAGPAISTPNVIVASRNGNVNALSLSSGSKVWTKNLGAVQIEGTPAIANGRALIGTFGGTMFMLNVTDGEIADQRAALKEISTNPIITGTQGIWASDDGALHSYGGEKPARADLAIQGLSPSSMINGQSATISGTVRNAGALDAPATSVAIRVNDQLVGDIQIDALAVGASESFSVSYTASRTGTLTVTAFADPARLIPESDESNNLATRTVSVTNPPVVDGGGGGTDTEKSPAPAGALTLAVLVAAVLFLARRRRLA